VGGLRQGAPVAGSFGLGGQESLRFHHYPVVACILIMKGIIPGMGALMSWTIIPSTGVQILSVGYYPTTGGRQSSVESYVYPLDFRGSHLTQRESIYLRRRKR
jgi:hypothetical protein